MKKNVLLLFALLIVSRAFAAVGLIMPDLSGQTGTQVTVPVKVTNFDNIIGIQFDVEFDPAVVTYSSVQNFGLSGMSASGNFGTTQAASGHITFSWGDPTLMGESLADSAVIFSMTFNIIGANASISNLDFANMIEVIDNSFATVPTTLHFGSITVQNPAVAGVTLFMDNASGPVGSQRSVSMKAVDFDDITSIQGTIQFDPMVETFSSISYFGLPGMNASNFGMSQIANGKITFNWFDAGLMGVDVADSVALFTFVFTSNCIPGTTLAEIVNNPTAIEVIDASLNTLNTTVFFGAITRVPLTVSAMATNVSICEGTSTTITATGNASSYSWLPTDSLSSSTGASVTADPSVTTIYTVTASESACSVTSTVTVTVDPLPVASFTHTDDGNGAYTFVNNSTSAVSYDWDFGDMTTGTQTSPTHTYTANGTYTVVVEATNACGTDNDTLILTVTSVPTIGLKAVSGTTGFEVYPNPGNGMFSLNYSANGSPYTVQVVNAIGEVIFSKECSDNLNPLDLSTFESGIYQVRIQDRDRVLNSKIILNK